MLLLKAAEPFYIKIHFISKNVLLKVLMMLLCFFLFSYFAFSISFFSIYILIISLKNVRYYTLRVKLGVVFFWEITHVISTDKKLHYFGIHIVDPFLFQLTRRHNLDLSVVLALWADKVGPSLHENCVRCQVTATWCQKMSGTKNQVHMWRSN